MNLFTSEYDNVQPLAEKLGGDYKDLQSRFEKAIQLCTLQVKKDYDDFCKNHKTSTQKQKVIVDESKGPAVDASHVDALNTVNRTTIPITTYTLDTLFTSAAIPDSPGSDDAATSMKKVPLINFENDINFTNFKTSLYKIGQVVALSTDVAKVEQGSDASAPAPILTLTDSNQTEEYIQKFNKKVDQYEQLNKQLVEKINKTKIEYLTNVGKFDVDINIAKSKLTNLETEQLKRVKSIATTQATGQQTSTTTENETLETTQYENLITNAKTELESIESKQKTYNDYIKFIDRFLETLNSEYVENQVDNAETLAKLHTYVDKFKKQEDKAKEVADRTERKDTELNGDEYNFEPKYQNIEKATDIFGVKEMDEFEDEYTALYKAIYSKISELFEDYLHEYMTKFRKKNLYIKRAGAEIQRRLDIDIKGSSVKNGNELENAKQVRHYKDLQGKIEQHRTNAIIAANKIEGLMTSLEERVSIVVIMIKSFDLIFDSPNDQYASKKLKIEQKGKELVMLVKRAREKLTSVYNNKVTLMDIIMDKQFLALYALKIVEYGLIVGSMFLTETIFSNMYMQQVYANNGNPPNLMIMLAIFIALELGFIIFLVVILYLVHLIADKHGIRNFVINHDLIIKFLIDYGVTTLILFILLSIICFFIQSKKLFRYKTEGLRAVRAFADIGRSIAPIVLLVPYFALF